MILVLRRLFVMHIISLSISVVAYSQETSKNTFWRVYVDNDFLNIRGRGTDRAYSGGTRIDMFVEKSRKPVLVPRFMNTLKDSMIFITQWGVMQMIFTPNNIDVPYFQPHDYFYSGALFLTHAAYAYSPVRGYSFQTEIQSGVRGPSAFGKEMQTSIHRMINYRLPKGWENQLKNVPVINLNFTLEKQLAAASSWVELIAGTKWRMGTLESGISIYPLLRLGLMRPYFNGYIRQFTDRNAARRKKERIQAYLVVRPEMRWTLNNGLLQVKSLKTKKVEKRDPESIVGYAEINGSQQKLIRHFVYSASYGAVVSTGKFAISYMQNSSTELRKKTYSHEYGNLSLFFNL